MFCADWALVKHRSHEITVSPLLCKCWTCDTCRPIRAARLVREAQSGKPTRFITLTSRRTPGACPHRAARALVIAWRTIRLEYLKRHGRRSLAFLAVFEATKQGWPHLHIVVRSKWIDQRWLSDRMNSLTGSPVVDVRKVTGVRKVAAYVAKYIGKNPHRFIGVKRYWRSLDYLFPVPDIDKDDTECPEYTSIHKFNWLTEVRYYVEQGYTAVFERNQCILTPGKPP